VVYGKVRQSLNLVCRSKSAKSEHKQRKRQNGKDFGVKRDRGVLKVKKEERKYDTPRAIFSENFAVLPLLELKFYIPVN